MFPAAKKRLFPTFTIAENVAWPLKFLRIRWREAERRASTLLEQLGIPRAAFVRIPSEMSGGEQQRVAIARALVTSPRLLLADEPTGNLDSKNGEAVMELLRELHREGATICMVTHNPDYATFATRTVRLFDGRIVDEARAA